MLEQFRRNLARWIAPAGRNQTRQYSAARASRLTADWNPADGSADSELVTSLRALRSRSRALVRDASYAKRAKVVVVNNVIGSGIGMQAQVMTSRDSLADRTNDSIEAGWEEFWLEAANCHTGGRLSGPSLERALVGQVFEAGDVFVREHFQPFGPMGVPYALELIEAERVADELTSPFLAAQSGNEIRMGVEVDKFQRPVAYYFRRRHRNEFRFGGGSPDDVDRVPADQVIHLGVIDRWPQTRGEPWMHTALRTFQDMSGYTDAEITRARIQASQPWSIETPEDGSSLGEEQEDGSVEMEAEPGVIKRLNPGEKLNAPPINSPNPALDPFMRYMLREVAAGVGVSYESISRDYSQSNYSSSRLALLDDRDLWRVLQTWFIREFRHRVHRRWLQQAMLARKIDGVSVEQYATNSKKFEAVLFKPRGWSWIDPTKEVEAYQAAIKSGFTTRTDVIAQTAGGQDIEDIDTIRERELRMAKEKGLQFDTDPDFYMADVEKAKAEAKAAAKPPTPPPDTAPNDGAPSDSQNNPAPSRVFRFQR